MIYCGIHQADHSPAEFAACLASQRPAQQGDPGDGE